MLIIIMLVMGASFLSASTASANNPFTTKSDPQQITPKPLIKTKLFVQIVFWQQLLREKMSRRIGEIKTTKRLTPIFALIAFAFIYGAVHSAGPGHGKAVALSYILSGQPSFFKGLIFGNIVALTHGFSGIFFVLIVKYLLQSSISTSLDAITNITQNISYSLIICLGLIIFFRSIYKWIKKKTANNKPNTKQFTNPFLTAMAVGMIPCPGVVMVMLFAISMDLTWLGILLGATISFGMASTITLIVMAGMTGKAAVLLLSSRHTKILTTLEFIIQAMAGLLMACFGFIFLL
jgi:ABC-type nickel/cobalt efflux system permease component RcnA